MRVSRGAIFRNYTKAPREHQAPVPRAFLLALHVYCQVIRSFVLFVKPHARLQDRILSARICRLQTSIQQDAVPDSPHCRPGRRCMFTFQRHFCFLGGRLALHMLGTMSNKTPCRLKLKPKPVTRRPTRPCRPLSTACRPSSPPSRPPPRLL